MDIGSVTHPRDGYTAQKIPANQAAHTHAVPIIAYHPIGPPIAQGMKYKHTDIVPTIHVFRKPNIVVQKIITAPAIMAHRAAANAAAAMTT